ncbi:unnamed protein product [Adineta ricciae]|uniref:Peptidase S1 domain-containing protein n=1 Tax=Adineta ricciae TaxID=249248 RepID=A0A814W7Y8_ADIRI|nr:unnamed protein product [Adineta ricciae]CAF1562346.1 unnamed protein product [Adineta ricciae]
MRLAIVLVCLTLIHFSHGRQYLCDSTAKCGCSKKQPMLSRIISEHMNNDGYWGWIVSIKKADQPTCGGSIISNSWILTSASCVREIPRQLLSVAVGLSNVQSSTQTRPAAEIIIHPNHNQSFFINDIALIRLEAPLNTDDPSIAQICLPAETAGNYSSDNSSLVALSWGVSSEWGPLSVKDKAYGKLREVPTTAVSIDSEDCQSIITDDSTQLCAQVVKPNIDTCAGDAGNPLMVYTPSRQWIVVGLVSFGILCDGQYPSVYTRVSAYLDWIKLKTGIGSTAK